MRLPGCYCRPLPSLFLSFIDKCSMACDKCVLDDEKDIVYKAKMGVCWPEVHWAARTMGFLDGDLAIYMPCVACSLAHLEPHHVKKFLLNKKFIKILTKTIVSSN